VSDQHPHDGEGPSPAEGVSPEREASVQLGSGGRGSGPASASMMDPANESLADALRITFRILQLAMAVLVGLYLLSGFQSVRTNERGVRLFLGRVSATDLTPGFKFSAPYPFGELVKIDVGNRDLKLLRPFWPYVEPGREEQSIDTLSRRASLNPEQDGSILTGDGAIAHTQWAVQYRRSDPRVFVENVFPAHEAGFVRAAVARGAVHAVASVRIDDLLKQSSSDLGSVATRARTIARETLDSVGEVGTGLEIEQLSLSQKIPPAYLRDKFTSVLDAESRASAARENAERAAATLLSQTAGGAAEELIALIDEYERLTDLGREDEAAAALARIDRVFGGLPVDVGGEEVVLSLGGEVATTLSRARQYRDSAEDVARAELANFLAKRENFRSNPSVMVASSWIEAMSSFFSDESLEVFFQPSRTGVFELVINADPEIRAEQERQRRLRQNEEARQRRLEEMERSRFETQEGLRIRGG
jgi:modulator of FtsH protease HflK